VKKLVTLLVLFSLLILGCATSGMFTCKETCGLNGARVYEHNLGKCECDKIIRSKISGDFGCQVREIK